MRLDYTSSTPSMVQDSVEPEIHELQMSECQTYQFAVCWGESSKGQPQEGLHCRFGFDLDFLQRASLWGCSKILGQGP